MRHGKCEGGGYLPSASIANGVPKIGNGVWR